MALVFCPYGHTNGTVAEIVSIEADEESGNDHVTYRCPDGHEWIGVSRMQIVRMIGWGHNWRTKGEQISQDLSGDDPEPLNRQQITPILGF